LIHYLWFFPHAPAKSVFDITDLSAGTFGFRAWGSHVKISEVRVSTVKAGDNIFESGEKWGRAWEEDLSI